MEAVSPRPNFIGTPEHVADELIRWFDAGASDGFILGFAAQREGLDDFVTQVLPILQARGYHQRELEGADPARASGPAVQGQPPCDRRRTGAEGRVGR
jgi:hypothetical protein